MAHTDKVTPGNVDKRCEVCGSRKDRAKTALCEQCVVAIKTLNHLWKPTDEN